MKRTPINIKRIALNAVLLLALALPAVAQHNDGNNGAGARPAPPSNGGGGGGGGARPSFNGGGGGQRPTFNGGDVGQRPSFNAGAPRSTNGAAPQTNLAPRTFNQGGQPRGNYNNNNNMGAPRNFGPRQGYAAGQRGVSASAQIGLNATQQPRYRNYSGDNGVTRIGGSGRVAGGNYNAHGYYNSFYAPHIGYRLNVLPRGYYPFYWGPNQYFYDDGLYYQYLNDQYEVVEPPVGAAVNTLPDNAQPIMINGVQYYELNGVYYQPITRDDGAVVYQVAGKDGELNTDDGAGVQGNVAPPQIGDMVSTLPQGCRTLRINGQKYYVSPDDYYYQSARDNNNNKVYKIVGTPSDEPNQ